MDKTWKKRKTCKRTFAGQNSVSIWLKGKNWVSERCSKEKCVAFGRLCIPQIPPNRPQDPGYVCILHPFLPAALPLFLPPESPILHHFLRHVSRLSSSGRRVYLPTGELTPSSANIAPDSTSCCPEGGTKCQTTPAPCHNRLHSDTPHHTIRAQPENFGTCARELSGDIFYAKDVPRQRALCHPPPTFGAPWVFPKFPPRKKPLHISPFYQTLDTLRYKRRQCLRTTAEVEKAVHFSKFYEPALPWPVSTTLPPFRPQN